MRLIDADKLKKHYAWWDDDRQKLFDEIVDQQPTVDALPVVRCMDCVRYFYGVCTLHGGPFSPDAEFVSEDGYCDVGKRRDR